MALKREDLYRASTTGLAIRAVPAEGDGDAAAAGTGLPRLEGHFTVFNQWTEIHDAWEGDFLERIAPGAAKKTIRENRDQMRVLFQHGYDPVAGDKPLASIDQLKEDEIGPYFLTEPMLDTSYNRDIAPGIEAGLYGISFRFRVTREDIIEEPDPSDYNPRGLPERTIKEMQVMEFGPVTFPAYPGADIQAASARSITGLIHDTRAVADAAGVFLDEERLEAVRLFASRGGAIVPPHSVDPPPDEDRDADAPPAPDADPPQDHLHEGRRGDEAQTNDGRWWERDNRDEGGKPGWARSTN